MYRLLNKEARAPLPVVHREIRRYQRSVPSAMSDFEFNRVCIAILHHHNWRKRDYIAELRRTARRARYVRRVMATKPRTP